MSSLLVCAQPATGLPDVFVFAESSTPLIKKLATVPRLSPVTPASQIQVRAASELASTGVPAIDLLTGGLPRGCLSEICGPASSGRTSVLLATLAAATGRREACALVDVSDAFDPQSAQAAGVEFKNLLWVRCDPEQQRPRKRPSIPLRAGSAETNKRKSDFDCLDQALRVTDLLLQSGGFGLVAIDLGDLPAPTARRIPLTSWFRFRRAVEYTPAILLVLARGSCARTCASLVVELKASGVERRTLGKLSPVGSQLSGETTPAHGQILTSMEVRAEILRSRLERKPVQSVTAFKTRVNKCG
jgi:hypothetical protein